MPDPLVPPAGVAPSAIPIPIEDVVSGQLLLHQNGRGLLGRVFERAGFPALVTLILLIGGGYFASKVLDRMIAIEARLVAIEVRLTERRP